MPRDPKPWFRKDRNAWFVTINGRRFNLGNDREAAHVRFHELMLTGGEDRPVGPISVFSLFDQFLEWCQAQRAQQTYEWYCKNLEAFAKYLKVDRPAASLRPLHLIQWTAKHPKWSTTTQRNALRSVQRAFRWAFRIGLIEANPIEYVEKPSAKRREQIVSPEEYPIVLANIRSKPFRDLVVAAWETGARPQELVRLEVRHVDLANSRWVFPPSESKIKTRHRIVYLNAEARRLTCKLTAVAKSGHIFRNQVGTPWQPYSIGCQFSRLKARIDRRLCLYTFRHSFATRMLTAGVDPMTVATLLGHSDTSMLGKVYQHLAQCPDHLLAQLNRVDKPAESA